MGDWLWRQLMTDALEASKVVSSVRPSSVSGWARQVTSDGFKALVLHRVRERLRRYRIPVANHVLRRMTTVLYGMELGNGVTLGDGVAFIHTLGVVVGGDAKVGARVRFMGNNTVGTAKDNGYPTIEDDVTLGAGARVLGPIRVGRGAVIGANAVVIRDVPPGAVVTGVPGVIRAARPPAAERSGDGSDGVSGPAEDHSTSTVHSRRA